MKTFIKSYFVHPALDDTPSSADTSKDAMRALLLSFVVLFITGLLQVGAALFTGSAALLSDTVHNIADAFSAIPLILAFLLSRRLPTRRFTYGFSRAEDVGGVVVLILILLSAVLTAWTSVNAFTSPHPVVALPVVVVAAAVGFIGNELTARIRIKAGRRIGSAALITDGMHARTDSLTSLAVIVGALFVALGFPLADPIVGAGITVLILMMLKDSAKEVLTRLLDGVDPELTDLAENALRPIPLLLPPEVRLRWSGHTLLVEATLTPLPNQDAEALYCLTKSAETLLLQVPRVARAHIMLSSPE